MIFCVDVVSGIFVHSMTIATKAQSHEVFSFIFARLIRVIRGLIDFALCLGVFVAMVLKLLTNRMLFLLMKMMRDEFADQPHGNDLDSHKHQQYAKKQQGTVTQRNAEKPVHG